MEEAAGWAIDPDTLQPVLTDRQRISRTLASAAPAERLFLLPLLGQLDRAFVESEVLLQDPQVRRDPWQALLMTAELHRWREEPQATDRLLTAAWKHARSRSRQASTLQLLGRRRFQHRELDLAACCFELALTMRRGFGEPQLVASSESALSRTRELLGYDAIVLAGGQGVRLGGSQGGSKASIPLAGWPLVDHVLLAVSGAGRRIVVGPNRIALGSPVFCREQPAGGGPVAAIAEAAGRVRQPTVAVLAADLPFIGPALASLRQCVTLTGQDAGVLVDLTGRRNYLASVWRTSSLLQALDRLGDPAGLPMRALYQGLAIATVPDFDADGADVDTPADLHSAQQRITHRTPGQLPAALLAWPRLELHAPS